MSTAQLWYEAHLKLSLATIFKRGKLLVQGCRHVCPLKVVGIWLLPRISQVLGLRVTRVKFMNV